MILYIIVTVTIFMAVIRAGVIDEEFTGHKATPPPNQ